MIGEFAMLRTRSLLTPFNAIKQKSSQDLRVPSYLKARSTSLLNQTTSRCKWQLDSQPSRGIFLLAIILLITVPVWASLGTDVVVSTDNAKASTSISTPSFSTLASNELLLAFVSTDSLSARMTVTGVTGGGITWVLVQRTNVQMGTSEIWRAFAPSTLSAAVVKATLSKSVVGSMTVVTFAGADPSGTSGSGAIGATGSGNANPGAPTATLVTTRSNS